MFRSKRSALAKRLWKLRVLTESSRIVGTDHDEARGALETNSVEMKIKSVAHSMLKRLKEVQLESLFRAVESQGADLSDCVRVPRGDIRIGGLGSIPPNLLCCRLWRWPDLTGDTTLKQLPCCQCIDDPLYICCNPYHWSKLFIIDSPPPPYSRYPVEDKSQDHTPDIPANMLTVNGDVIHNGSVTTNNNIGVLDVPPDISSSYHDSDYNPRQMQGWCNIAYWEMDTRVGRLFPVFKPYLSIFGDVPLGDGLSITSLTHTNRTTNESVIRTRYKIGLGVMLYKEEENVWLYNRSDIPVFVSSPTMDLPNTRTLMVYKVLPGYSVNIFDYQKSEGYQRIHNPELFDGPVDRNFVRISFAKGWGPKYSRQFVTCCPCSLEILMSPQPR